jgi:inorganic pyrophosphatase
VSVRDVGVDVLVEIPRGSRNKYEYDAASGRIRLDRVLYSSVHYPTDYGFVLGTRARDGDPLDALVVVEEPTFPGCVVPVRPIGVLDMRDEHGEDTKILAVPLGDPRFTGIVDLADLSPQWLREIATFFATYKTLQAIDTDVRDWRGAEAARAAIAACRVPELRAVGDPDESTAPGPGRDPA